MAGKSLIYLTGYRGSGKTTVGQLLARELGWQFIDADQFLEAKFHRTIREIFAEEGESGFRDKETAMLRELSALDKHVVATGGGIILREENRKVLQESGRVIWLKADAKSLWERIQGDPTTSARRPNLLGGGIAEVEDLLAKREPHYRSCADLEIDVAGPSPSEVVATILTAWKTSL
jgi:shikimate kinase